MKKSALRFLILTWLVMVALCASYNFVTERKTWSEAREYCREHYTDLPSINNQEEDENLFTIVQTTQLGMVWIGLHKDADDKWKWSGGRDALFFNWSAAQNHSEENRCVVRGTKGWRKINCERKLYFYCSHSIMVLVKENKTWEEAMNHCRDQHTDLVSLPSESVLVQTLQTSKEAQTDHVWTGLRYLADSWLWVDGDDMRYQNWSQGGTPQCPAWSHHCGVLSMEGKHWDSQDCADKLNFVCY